MAESVRAAPSNAPSSRALRQNFGRPSSRRYVLNGEMSKVAAQKIFVNFAQFVGATTDDARGELLQAMAEVFWQGTSEETDWDAVFIYYGGEQISMGPFAGICNENYAGANPIRTWCRCFNDGLMAVYVNHFLAHPENVSERSAAALRYNTHVENGPVCFDFADALLKTKIVQLKPEQIRLIRNLRNEKTDEVNARRAGTQFTRTEHGSTQPVVAPAPQNERTRFTPIR